MWQRWQDVKHEVRWILSFLQATSSAQESTICIGVSFAFINIGCLTLCFLKTQIFRLMKHYIYIYIHIYIYIVYFWQNKPRNNILLFQYNLLIVSLCAVFLHGVIFWISVWFCLYTSSSPSAFIVLIWTWGSRNLALEFLLNYDNKIELLSKLDITGSHCMTVFLLSYLNLQDNMKLVFLYQFLTMFFALLALFSYFEENKVALWGHLAVCVCTPDPNNIWTPEPVCM
jgi:hypothetical protein